MVLSDEINKWTMLSSSEPTDNSVTSSQTRNKASSAKNAFGGFSYIRTALFRQGVPEETADVIIKSWRVNTPKQYEPYIKSWLYFCSRKDNPINPIINTALKFLTKLFKTGVSYSTMGTSRSVISTFLKLCGNIDINNFACVTRFMKGIFNERPALLRYNVIWDVKSVQEYI